MVRTVGDIIRIALERVFLATLYRLAVISVTIAKMISACPNRAESTQMVKADLHTLGNQDGSTARFPVEGEALLHMRQQLTAPAR